MIKINKFKKCRFYIAIIIILYFIFHNENIELKNFDIDFLNSIYKNDNNASLLIIWKNWLKPDINYLINFLVNLIQLDILITCYIII